MPWTDMLSGLAALGVNPHDVPATVEGTLPQQGAKKFLPRPTEREDLWQLFRGVMRYWRGALRANLAKTPP